MPHAYGLRVEEAIFKVHISLAERSVYRGGYCISTRYRIVGGTRLSVLGQLSTTQMR